MKPIKIKLPERKKYKETQEERKERIKYASTTRTRIIGNKKYKTRAQRKAEERNEKDIF